MTFEKFDWKDDDKDKDKDNDKDIKRTPLKSDPRFWPDQQKDNYNYKDKDKDKLKTMTKTLREHPERATL